MTDQHTEEPTESFPFRGVRHFQGLNSLRFVAAVLVLLAHGEAIRTKRGLPGFADLSLFNNGATAVSFFFVLSGFLICYLLLEERSTRGTISVISFYRRRALRILPLYFAIVIIGLLVIPASLPLLGIEYALPYDAPDVVMWYVVLMPFVVNLLYDVFVIGPLWSIGVEEWFYILIAPLFKLDRIVIVRVLCSVIIIKVAALAYVDITGAETFTAQLLRLVSFEHMAVGGLIAVFIRERRTTTLFTHAWRILCRSTVMLLLMARVFAHSWLEQTFSSYALISKSYAGTSLFDALLFGWIILDIVTNNGRSNGWAIPKVDDRNRMFRSLEDLGSLSYGIYMYHNIIAFSLTYGLMEFWRMNDVAVSLPLYHGALIAATLCVAALSKRFFEDPFLRYR